MLIHPCTPKYENGELVVSARIEMEKPPYDVPEVVWFKFPEAQAHLVSDNADGFAVALLSLALCRGENIRICDTMSAALTYGMQECQRVQNYRKPQRYHPIEIEADAYARRTASGFKNASTLSGGVDSFYSVWSHVAQNEKVRGNEVAYAVLVQGFDIGLHDHYTFEQCSTSYRKVLREWGVELLTVRTNVRAFDKPTNWISGCTFATIGLGHFLGCGVSRYYVPANDFYADYPKGAVATLADALLSSESVQVVADGAQLTKFEKIVALSNVDAIYSQLRVCSAKPNGVMNCCECRKCINAMTALELCGTLQNFSTFPLPLDGNKRRFSDISYSARAIYMDYFKRALALKRNDLAVDMAIKIGLNYLRWGRKWAAQTVTQLKSARDTQPAPGQG